MTILSYFQLGAMHRGVMLCLFLCVSFISNQAIAAEYCAFKTSNPSNPQPNSSKQCGSQLAVVYNAVRDAAAASDAVVLYPSTTVLGTTNPETADYYNNAFRNRLNSVLNFMGQSSLPAYDYLATLKYCKKLVNNLFHDAGDAITQIDNRLEGLTEHNATGTFKNTLSNRAEAIGNAAQVETIRQIEMQTRINAVIMEFNSALHALLPEYTVLREDYRALRESESEHQEQLNAIAQTANSLYGHIELSALVINLDSLILEQASSVQSVRYRTSRLSVLFSEAKSQFESSLNPYLEHLDEVEVTFDMTVVDRVSYSLTEMTAYCEARRELFQTMADKLVGEIQSRIVSLYQQTVDETYMAQIQQSIELSNSSEFVELVSAKIQAAKHDEVVSSIPQVVYRRPQYDNLTAFLEWAEICSPASGEIPEWMTSGCVLIEEQAPTIERMLNRFALYMQVDQFRLRNHGQVETELLDEIDAYLVNTDIDSAIRLHDSILRDLDNPAFDRSVIASIEYVPSCDVDEPCVDNASCSDEDDGPLCECEAGLEGDGFRTGTGCFDIDECENEIDTCSDNARCENSFGTYYCTCANGFSGDGFDCADINECTETADVCSEDEHCENTIGSYDCLCGDGSYGENGEWECAENEAANNFFSRIKISFKRFVFRFNFSNWKLF